MGQRLAEMVENLSRDYTDYQQGIIRRALHYVFESRPEFYDLLEKRQIDSERFRRDENTPDPEVLALLQEQIAKERIDTLAELFAYSLRDLLFQEARNELMELTRKKVDIRYMLTVEGIAAAHGEDTDLEAEAVEISEEFPELREEFIRALELVLTEERVHVVELMEAREGARK